jgi:hypothetical protein
LFVIFEAVVPLLPAAARLRLLCVQIRRILIGFDKRFESSLPPVEALPRSEPLTLRLLPLALGLLLRLVETLFAGLISKALAIVQGKRELFEILF